MERWQRELEEDWENEELVEEMYANNPPYNIDELTKEDVLSNMVMDYLVSIKNIFSIFNKDIIP